MLFPKNTRTSAFLSGTFPLRPRLASCMRNGELSRAPAATRQAALRRLGTLVRNKAVETVDGIALAARGRRFRIAFTKDSLHSRGSRRFDFLRDIRIHLSAQFPARESVLPDFSLKRLERRALAVPRDQPLAEGDARTQPRFFGMVLPSRRLKAIAFIRLALPA